MPTWFQCKIVYIKEDDKGVLKTINEAYLVDAVSFIDAETRLAKHLETSHRNYSLDKCAKKKIADVFPYEEDELWFECKVVYVTLDERSGKEKEIKNTMIVNALNAKQAYERIEESLNTMLVPFSIPKVVATAILEVYPYTDSKQLGLDFGNKLNRVIISPGTNLPKEELKRGDHVLIHEGAHFGKRGVITDLYMDKLKACVMLSEEGSPEVEVWIVDVKLLDAEGYVRSKLFSTDEMEVRVQVDRPYNNKERSKTV